MHWDNEKGANIVMAGGKKVFKSYLLGTFSDPDVKGKVCDTILFSCPDLMPWIEQAETKVHD